MYLATNDQIAMTIRIKIRIQEFLDGILPLWDRGVCENFPGSAAASAKVRSHQALLVVF